MTLSKENAPLRKICTRNVFAKTIGKRFLAKNVYSHDGISNIDTKMGVIPTALMDVLGFAKICYALWYCGF